MCDPYVRHIYSKSSKSARLINGALISSFLLLVCLFVHLLLLVRLLGVLLLRYGFLHVDQRHLVELIPGLSARGYVNLRAAVCIVLLELVAHLQVNLLALVGRDLRLNKQEFIIYK